MSEYGILSKEVEIFAEYLDGWARYERGRHWDIIEAETPAKAKYIFYKKYLSDDGFIDGMAMIEECQLYRCPLCSGQELPEGYTLEEYGDEPCQFCEPRQE